MMQPSTPDTRQRFLPLAVATTTTTATEPQPAPSLPNTPLQQALLTRNYQPPQPAMASALLDDVEVWLYKV